jgi:hypothetical protein
MRKQKLCQSSLTIGLWALLCAVFAGSCALPAEPSYGEGTLTLCLPATRSKGGAVLVQSESAAASRSILSDTFVGALQYRVTISDGSGKTAALDVQGGGTTVSLGAGEWNIAASAYAANAPGVIVGTGNASVAIVAGQGVSKRISMTVDPAYEAALLDIYIHNETELRRIGAAVNGLAIDVPGRIFYLANDIVLTQPWTPIGTPSAPFKAQFDGQGHSITLRSLGGAAKEPGGNFVYQGFFAVVEDALIKNTVIAYELNNPVVDIRTGDGATYYDSHAGGVAGHAENTSFENIRVSGSFSVIGDGNSSLSVGGIAGSAGSGTTITECHVLGAIGGTSANYLVVGGIVGTMHGGSISGSSFVGDGISGSAPVGNCETGGIAGYVFEGEITACFARGHIQAEADSPNVGGIAGTISGGSSGSSITRSFAAGVMDGMASGSYSNSGGIAGRVVSSNSVIENSYASASVSSSASYGETAGGIAGINDGTISHCYMTGTVASKGANPYTKIGGIMGESSGAAAINGCMAIVVEIDAGPSTSTAKYAHAICADTYFSVLSDNYSMNSIMRTNALPSDPPAPGSTARDGEQRPLADFQSPALYAGAGWNFTAGTGDWKFINGYDYPVLSWQDAAPEQEAPPSLTPAGLEFGWD